VDADDSLTSISCSGFCASTPPRTRHQPATPYHEHSRHAHVRHVPAQLSALINLRAVGKISQDNLLRVVLRERDVPGGANIGLIDQTARFALTRGHHTIVEGIFNAGHYGAMLTALISDHPGRAFAYFLDVPFPETLRRHATKTGLLKSARRRCASGTADWTCCPAASSRSYRRHRHSETPWP
jgi:hypothetical protein